MEKENIITIEMLVQAYHAGYFPMADDGGDISWYNPDPRAIIPIETYKPSKSLKPVINKAYFEIRVDQNFQQVMRFCAAPRQNEPETWISEDIIQLYTELHHLGFAHSVEAYLDGQLVGGLYGVSFGAAFMGESMFSLVPNSSKVAFHYLIQILKSNDYTLLDTQFMNDNVKRYGAIEISKLAYLHQLNQALMKNCTFKLS